MERQSVIQNDIHKMEEAFLNYMKCMQQVYSYGDDCIEPLIASLKKNTAIPVSDTLSLMWKSPKMDVAILPLLNCLLGITPAFQVILRTLVLGGERVAPTLLLQIQQYIQAEDAHAVQHLFEAAIRMPDSFKPQVAKIAMELLEHSNLDFRCIGVDAIYELGLPFAKNAIDKLQYLLTTDTAQVCREDVIKTLERLGAY